MKSFGELVLIGLEKSLVYISDRNTWNFESFCIRILINSVNVLLSLRKLIIMTLY